ncbi:MAG: XRE family transcriptional regulator [Pedobacter sp.]|nr:MAG: XRE family transcriptional regulator [Pedobacter sp.]
MISVVNITAKTIAMNIRCIREFRQYTQHYLGVKLGISQNAYSKIELGNSTLNIDKLILISKILEVKLAYIVSNDYNQVFNLYKERLDQKILRVFGVMP